MSALPPKQSNSLPYSTIERFLLDLDVEDKEYLLLHLDRLVRTLMLVPEPGGTGRVLELGTYMQMAPALKLLLGYDVRGAYYGARGRTETKIAAAAGGEVFRCEIDLFDAERDEYPYGTGYFEGVLACEILEHLLCDPMAMLLEIRRILEPGGWILLTTPNCASLTSIQRALEGKNPQVFSKYDRRASGEIPHVREYTPQEIAMLLRAAGFELEFLFTEPVRPQETTWVPGVIVRAGFDAALRGEQIYCLARKAGSGPLERYPPFLYTEGRPA